MRFSPKLGSRFNLFSRLICLLLFLSTTTLHVRAQEGCQGAIPVHNAYPQNMMIGNPCNYSYSFNWTGPNGFSSNEIEIDIDVPGNYVLQVIDATGVEIIREYTFYSG